MKNTSRRAIPYNTKTWTQIGTLDATFDRVTSLCPASGVLYCSAYDYTVPTNFKVFSLNYATKAWTSIYTAENDAYPFILAEMSGSLYLGLERRVDVHNVYKLTPPSTWTGLGLPAGAGNKETLMLVPHAGKLYYTAAGTSLDVVYEFQSGTTWASIGIPVAGAVAVRLASCGGNLYAIARDPGTPANHLVKVWAGGTTWNAVATITPSVSGAGSYLISDGESMYATAGDAPGDVFKFTAPSTFTKVGVFPAGAVARAGIIHEGRLHLQRPDIYRLDQQDGSEITTIYTMPAGYAGLCSCSFNGKYLIGRYKASTASAGQVFELGMRHQGT